MVRLISIILYSLWFTTSALAVAPPAGLTYQGRVLRADGTPATGTFQFRIQIRTPSPSNCLMYEEYRNVPLAAAGAFALTIHDGSVTRSDAGLYEFEEIFLNRKSFTFAPSDCGPTSTFTPDATSTRQIVVMFNDGTTWEALPSMTTAFAPQSLESINVGGYGSGDLFRVDRTLPSQTVAAFTYSDYTKILDLIAGKLNGASLPTMASGQVLGSNGSGGWQAVTPLTALSVPTCATGEYLRGSSGTLVCATLSGAGGTGSVTSVDVSVPSYMTSAGGPVTSSGAIALSFNTQAAYQVFAGPTTGSAAPAFRNLGIADIRSTATGAFFQASGACTAGQTLTYSSVSDSVACAPYSLTSSQVTTALGYTPVNLAGDTMTGALNLPTNGLTVGTSQFVVSGGNIGIGTSTPSAKLEVAGQIKITGGTPGAGKVLTSDGAGLATWEPASATGLTSVSLSMPSVFTVTNSPLTSNGTIAVTANGTSGGIPYFASATTLASSAELTNHGLVVGGGAAAAPVSLTVGGSGTLLTGSTGSDPSFTSAPVLGTNGSVTGTIGLANGAATGATTTVAPSASTTTAYTFTLPATGGSSGQFLTTNGSGTTSWSTPAGTGTVNSGSLNQLAYYATNGTAVSGLATPASSVLVSNASSVPMWSALSNDTFSQYALLAGRSGGQTLYGGTAASDSLILNSTSHATKGALTLNPDGGSVGIGVAVPLAPLHLRSIMDAPVMVETIGTSSAPSVVLNRARGTIGSLSAAQAGDILGSLGAKGFGASAYSAYTIANMRFYAAENFTDSAQGTYIAFRTTPTGATSAVERVRIESNGNLGVATTTPGAISMGGFSTTFPNVKLDVGGDVAADSLYVRKSTSYAAAIDLPVLTFSTNQTARNSNVNTGWSIRTTSQASSGNPINLAFYPGLSSNYAAANNGNLDTLATLPTLQLNGNGNVGIGTTAPTTALEVNGTVKATNFVGTMTSTGSSNSAGYTINTDTDSAGSDGGLSLQVRGVTKLAITDTGRIGIGSATPTSLLANTATSTADAAGTGSSADSLTWLTNLAGYVATFTNTSTAATANGLLVKTSGTASTNRILNLNANGSDIMTVTGAGNVGIGTSAPAVSLDVVADQQNTTIRTSAFGFAAPTISSRRAMGSLSSPSAIDNERFLLSILSQGFDGSVYGDGPGLHLKSDAAWTSTSHPGYIQFITTPVASTATFERMRITSSGNVGIGTSLPAGSLDVASEGAGQTVIFSRSVSSSANGSGNFIASRTRGTMSAPTQVSSGDRIGTFLGTNGVTNDSWAGMQVLATEAHTAAAQGKSLQFSTTLNGSKSDSAKMTIDHNGNVGIGSTSPRASVQVGGSAWRSAYLSSASNIGGISYYSHLLGFNTSLDSSGQVTRYSDAGNRRGSAITSNSGALQFSTYSEAGGTADVTTDYTTFSNSFTRMVIAENGNVGIGTTSPTQMMHLSGATNAVVRISAPTSPELHIDQGNQYSGFQVRRSNDMGISAWQVKAVENLPMILGTNNLARMTIDASGNVGIGTTAPTENLQLGGDSATLTNNYVSLWGNVAGINAATSAIRFYNRQANGSSTTPKRIAEITSARDGDNFGGALYFNSAAAITGTIAERMRIDSSGNVVPIPTLPERSRRQHLMGP